MPPALWLAADAGVRMLSLAPVDLLIVILYFGIVLPYYPAPTR